MTNPEPHTTGAARMPAPDLAAVLVAALGATLVAYLANVRSRQLPTRWASGETEPRDGAKQRLMLAYQAFRPIADEENADVARAWLIGANPWLNGQSPAARIREHDAAAVYAAVDAFLDDTGGA